MSSVNSIEGEEVTTASEHRVRSLIVATMEEDELSEKARRVLQQLMSSDQDLAEIGMDELKQILLGAVR